MRYFSRNAKEETPEPVVRKWPPVVSIALVAGASTLAWVLAVPILARYAGTMATVAAVYAAHGALYAWILSPDRHVYADSITDSDPECARFECRWGWLRDLLIWPVHFGLGLSGLISAGVRMVRGM